MGVTAEELMFVKVKDCPNKGSGECALMHTCVEYDENGDVVNE